MHTIHIFLDYTQTKKTRPFFIVMYLSIQLRCQYKNNTKMFLKRQLHKY